MSYLTELDTLLKSMSEADRSTALENRFAYIYSKAHLFMKMKPEIYRKNDFFSQPPAEFDDEDIVLMKHGCQQVLEGKGFKQDNPFTGLGVGGFYALMRMFHFEPCGRKTLHLHKHVGKKGMLDCITFRHMVDENEVLYFNFCE